MSLKITRQRNITYETNYRLCFSYADGTSRSHGFSFDCDEHGLVDVAKLPNAAKQSYQGCLAGSIWLLMGVQYVDPFASHVLPIYCTGRWEERQLRPEGVESWENRIVQHAQGRCHCGLTVELHGFTNTCECGTDYNMSGQELAPRSQWGEETGESVADILSVDNHYELDRVFED